jgi:hypothetical protein
MWEPNDEYWELWLNGDTGEYEPRCEGVVSHVEDGFVRLIGGWWRGVDEGIAFKSRHEAQRYIAEQPRRPSSIPPASGIRELNPAFVIQRLPITTAR